MSNLLSILSQYSILSVTAPYLSTLDLFHLGLTNSDFHCLILQSAPLFNNLKLTALCDGKGLIERQEFRGVYAIIPENFTWGPTGKRPHYDEELEVRVWNRKCDAVNALPCLSCGINVCEECRYVPRVRDTMGRSYRRPHLEPTRSSCNVICYCTYCDENVEAGLPLSLSEYCDCNQYTRWICLKCKEQEERISGLYYQKRTKEFWDHAEFEPGMFLSDHQSWSAFWCPCGKRPPVDGNVRCAWCKRRHNLETWMDEDPDHIPEFDLDPSQPTGEPAWFRTGPLAAAFT